MCVRATQKRVQNFFQFQYISIYMKRRVKQKPKKPISYIFTILIYQIILYNVINEFVYFFFLLFQNKLSSHATIQFLGHDGVSFVMLMYSVQIYMFIFMNMNISRIACKYLLVVVVFVCSASSSSSFFIRQYYGSKI